MRNTRNLEMGGFNNQAQEETAESFFKWFTNFSHGVAQALANEDADDAQRFTALREQYRSAMASASVKRETALAAADAASEKIWRQAADDMSRIAMLLGSIGSPPFGAPLDIGSCDGASKTNACKFGGEFNCTVILDSHGQGSIAINDTTLTGGQREADHLWVSEDGAWRYIRLPNGDLRISQRSRGSVGQAITVRGYFKQPGQLGLNLSTALQKSPEGEVFAADFNAAALMAEGDASQHIECHSRPNGRTAVSLAPENGHSEDALHV